MFDIATLSNSVDSAISLKRAARSRSFISPWASVSTSQRSRRSAQYPPITASCPVRTPLTQGQSIQVSSDTGARKSEKVSACIQKQGVDAGALALVPQVGLRGAEVLLVRLDLEDRLDLLRQAVLLGVQPLYLVLQPAQLRGLPVELRVAVV